MLFGNNQKINDDKLVSLVKEINLFEDQVDVNLDMKISNKNLSSGQMQKISFMRALLSKVEVLLLDESTSNLDIETKTFIFDILKKQEITIINSTHNPEDFESVDRHLKIYFEGDLRKVKSV